jgi:DNA-binding NarL/FixJ family response regulator
MSIRLLIATADDEWGKLYRSLVDHALRLLPLDIVAREVTSQESLTRSVRDHEADVVLLDWLVAEAATPDYLRELLALDPSLRTIVTMPLHLRQYRACLWEAGACVGVPKEHLDQEWVLSMLCLITRAMAREARVRDDVLAGGGTVGSRALAGVPPER